MSQATENTTTIPSPKQRPPLTQARLKEVLHYDPETGVFIRRVQQYKYRAGEIVGWLDRKGYLRARIGPRQYPLHRLAWLYMTGEWPDNSIDHRDGNKTNNIFSNLRIATPMQNSANTKAHSDNASGLKGVSWSPVSKKFYSRIMSGGRCYYLGLYDTAEEAHAVYRDASKRINGEFARVK